eukprot:553092_1
MFNKHLRRVLMLLTVLFNVTLLAVLIITKSNLPFDNNTYTLLTTQKQPTTIKKTIHLKSIDNALNILVVMAVNCKYNITEIINSLQYNSNQMNIYWFFNVYNMHKCDIHLNETYVSILKDNSNVKIVRYHARKVMFWIEYINPNHIIFDNIQFDYIWLIDDDLLLNLFNFNSFIHLSYSLHSSISQPAIMSKCSECYRTNWPMGKWNKNNVKNGLIAKTANIEMQAPLFTFDTYKIVYPLMYEIFKVNNTDLTLTNWGIDIIWCGAAKMLIGNDCIVVYYTPIIHLDYHNIAKSSKFIQEGIEILKRVKATYPDFVGMHVNYTNEFYLVANKTQIPEING